MMTESGDMESDTRSAAFAQIKSTGKSCEGENWSETDTRSKLIDSLLLGCLGWKEKDIRRELHENGSRLDYRLSTIRTRLVIEAKKIAITLTTVCKTSPSTIKLDKLQKSYPDLKPHIQQLAKYCHDFSIPLGVLTNGQSFIFLCALRTDAVPWSHGDAIVINNIFEDTFSLRTLDVLLSREAVHDERLAKLLRHDSPSAAAVSVLSTYRDPLTLQVQNDLAQHLENALMRVFTDIADESDAILKYCYVKPAESSLGIDAIEFPLLDRPERDDLTVVDISNLNAFKQFEKTIANHLQDGKSGETLLIIGNMGVGKTMFLRRFFRRDCNPEHLPDRVLPFFLDYRTGTLSPDRAVEDAYGRLRRALNSLDDAEHNGSPQESSQAKADLSSPGALRVMFQSEIQRFQRNNQDIRNTPEYAKLESQEFVRLQGDDRCFVRAAFHYLRQHFHWRPCLVLDNADHHDADFQRHVYLAAKTLEGELACLVLLSLQERWYWHFRNEDSVLSYYQDKVFHIPAPRARDVLTKRLDYAIKIADDLFRDVRIELGNNILIEPKHLAEYLALCKTALFESNEVSEFFEAVSNGNVRKGLEIFATFMRSGHTNVRRYLRTVFLGEGLHFSLDDVVRSIARGRYRRYTNQRSVIPNLFVIGRVSINRDFARLVPCYVLQHLAALLRKERHNELGFVSRRELLLLCEDMGLSTGNAEDVLSQLEKCELVRVSEYGARNVGESHLRISGLGIYMIKRLVGNSAYLECVMLDTPIAVKDVFASIEGYYKEHLTVLQERRDICIKAFLRELEHHEDGEWPRAQTTAGGAELSKIVPDIRRKLEIVAKPS